MPFVLSEQCNADVVEAFKAYRKYLHGVRDRFPPSAYALATSDWNYNFEDHRSPHDGWLEYAQISEPSSGDRHQQRTIALTIRLLGAYHDGYVEFRYPKVYAYKLVLDDGTRGHRDWLRDEFRLADAGHLVHEIEWREQTGTANWLIEASDVEFQWIDFKSN
jgi:hypothetical protein